MKKTIFILLFFTGSLNLFSQIFDSDTIKNVTIIRRKTGLEFSLGIGGLFFDHATRKYLKNELSSSSLYRFFYKNYFIGFQMQNLDLQFINSIYNSKYYANKKDILSGINTSFLFGTNFLFNKKYSIEPYVGFNYLEFSIYNYKDFNNFSTSGSIVGIRMNKYLKHNRPFSGFNLFLDANYNIVSFKQLDLHLGENFLFLSFGIAYKGWFTKRKYN